MQPFPSDITILIKTFNRKKCLIKLLRSLVKLDCRISILIADDSEQPYKDEILATFPELMVTYVVLPFDTGLAGGRNLLLSMVETPYFILCDDDFCFDQHTDLNSVMMQIKANNIDIAGGRFLNHITINSIRGAARLLLNPIKAFRYLSGRYVIVRYYGHFHVHNTTCELSISNKKQASPIYPCDLVNNYFIGKTSSVLKIKGWDESFKVGEHEDFFYRAKLARLNVAMMEALSIHHYPKAGKIYRAFRERSGELKKNFPKKFSFSIYKEINSDTGKLLYSYRSDNQLIT